MKSTAIIDQGTIDTTLPEPTDSAYQMAALSLFLRQQFAVLRSSGFEFQKAEVSDITAYSNGLKGWLENAQQRETEIIKTGVSEVVANLPDVLAIGAAYMSGGASAAIGAALNIMLERLLGGEPGAIASNENQTDFTEIVSKLEEMRVKLEEMRVQIASVLTEFNINIIKPETDDESSWSVGFPLSP